ncbi:MAG: hypothetical protein HFJ06_11305 [Lachnospiraceae bacterium]|nr:hypothetical protein [Lachnospiraceae bacterium]
MQEEVDNVKGKEDWRAEYMTMMEIERERYREGLEKGIEQGINQGIYQGEAKMLINLNREYGMDNESILQSLQDKLGISLEQATRYLKEYGGGDNTYEKIFRRI